jgi:SDR family mycofactocin-dependent oxidoreductase
MGLLTGKVVLVTGAARGMGRAHAVVSAREGADVIALDTNADIATVGYPLARSADLAETVSGVEKHGRKALGLTVDVRSQNQLDAAVDRALTDFGHIDAVIANAGVWGSGNFWELTEAEWDDVLAVNLTGVWKAVKSVAPHLIERKSGSVVVISSVNGIEPAQTYAHYISSKHGVLGLMKAMASEFAPHGVRCNAICPGAIDTPMSGSQMALDMYAGGSGGTRENQIEVGYHYSVLRGVGFLSPTSVAEAAAFLNSDRAAAITGISLPVDAGHLLLPGINQEPIR